MDYKQVNENILYCLDLLQKETSPEAKVIRLTLLQCKIMLLQGYFLDWLIMGGDANARVDDSNSTNHSNDTTLG